MHRDNPWSILGSNTQAEPEQLPQKQRIILRRTSKQTPSLASSTYRGVMLHRVADVEHFSCLGVHGARGKLLPRESWGRGGGREEGERGRGRAGSARDAALATRVPPPSVGFFAFFISLSSVNSLHPTTKRGPPLLSLMTIH